MNSLFKECLNADLDTFLNVEEFGEVHKIFDDEFVIVVQDYVSEREKQGLRAFDNVSSNLYQESKTIFLKESEIRRPSITERIEFDGEPYVVTDTEVTGGLLKIIITKNESFG